MWTTRQALVLAALMLAIAAGLAIRAANRTVDISAPGVVNERITGHLADRLDPNTAPWESLAAIPELGQRRAHDIVAYRTAHPHLPFTRVEDLLRVSGIGPATLANLEPYLVFATPVPATGP